MTASLGGELLLQLGLVVDVTLERVVDALLEGVHDGRADGLEGVLEVERAQARLDEGGEDVPVRREAPELSESTAAALPAKSSPRPMRLPTIAQLWRETTCARIFASGPPARSGKRS